MRKTVQAFLAENDEEFTYYIKSIWNIHDPSVMTMIRLGLLSFDLRDLDKDYTKPVSKDNNDFPMFPNTPCYVLKAITGMLIPQPEQRIALYTNIEPEHLLIHLKGERPERDDDDNDDEPAKNKHMVRNGNGKFEELVVKDEQDLVGTERIGKLFKELHSARKERESDWVEREVYEAYVTSHLILSQAIGKPLRKGFYTVERYTDDKNRMIAEGPFDAIPKGYEFLGELPGIEPKGILAENRENGRLLVEFAVSDAPVGPPQTFRVKVQSVDTGREWTVSVKASSDSTARDRGIRAIAAREKVSPESLVAEQPRAAN